MFLSSGITAIKARYERQFVIALPGIRCNVWGQHKSEEQWSGISGHLALPHLGTDMKNKDCGLGWSGAWICLSLAQTWVVRGDQALDSASSWHRHEEQGLWSGVIRCLNLPQLSTYKWSGGIRHLTLRHLGTDMKNKDCGPDWSGAWICVSLAQTSGQGGSGTWLCVILPQTWRTRTVVRGIRYLTLPQPGVKQSTVFINMSYTFHTSVPVDINSEFSRHWRPILPQHNWLLQDCIAFTQYGRWKLILHTDMLPIIRIGAVLKDSRISF